MNRNTSEFYICLVLSLEGDEVPGVVLHPRQPVDDELVVLARGEAHVRQLLAQKRGGVQTRHQ